jgi:hypothetical protein
LFTLDFALGSPMKREPCVLAALHRGAAIAAAAIVLVVSWSTAAWAQDPDPDNMGPEVKAVQAEVEAFFKAFSPRSLGPEAAIRQIIGDGPLKNRTEEISQLSDQAEQLDSRYGAYVGHELVSTRVSGKSVIFLRYLYKGERFPVVFYFTFYRPGAAALLPVQPKWSLISLRFDARLEALDR